MIPLDSSDETAIFWIAIEGEQICAYLFLSDGVGSDRLGGDPLRSTRIPDSMYRTIPYPFSDRYEVPVDVTRIETRISIGCCLESELSRESYRGDLDTSWDVTRGEGDIFWEFPSCLLERVVGVSIEHD